MRNAISLVTAIVVAYVLWHLSDPSQRSRLCRFLDRHTYAVVATASALFLLIVLAVGIYPPIAV
jgi:hypothetical protein